MSEVSQRGSGGRRAGSHRGGRARSRRGRGGRCTPPPTDLPYDGDIQEAMRLEDREAIRALLNAKQHKAASRVADEATANARRGKKWWRSSTDVDPISLEPLSELEYAPFQCGKHYFDGRVLAFFLVSTGTFTNPMSREQLTLDDCIRLDVYLNRHDLGQARVADAFRLQQTIRSSASNEVNSAQAETQRRHATAVLHSLFGFARYGDQSGTPVEGRSILQALDDDNNDDDDNDEDTLRGEEVKEESEAFPALVGEHVEAAQATSANHQANWARAARSGPAIGEIADFPALPGGGATTRPASPNVPHFRNAVASYAVSAASARNDEASDKYAAAARAVADNYPALPPSVAAHQYRALAMAHMRARPVATQQQHNQQEDQTTKRQRERQRRREKKKAGGSVVARIRDAAGEEALAALREKTLQLRRGEIEPATLYEAALDLLPNDRFHELFTGLVAIIPDPDARRDLEKIVHRCQDLPLSASSVVHERESEAAVIPPSQPPPPPMAALQPAAAQPMRDIVPPAANASDFPSLSRASRAAAPAQKNRPASANSGWANALRQYDTAAAQKAASGGKKTGLSLVVPRKSAK